MVPEPTTVGVGPHENALRAAHLRPTFERTGEQFEARVRVKDDFYYGYGATREAASRDLVQDLPEPLERQVSRALRA